MNSKDRLLQFVGETRVSHFEKKAGLTHRTLASNANISATNLEKIHMAFPELNMDWVITGRGTMLVDDLGADNVFGAEKYELWQKKAAELEKELALKNELLELYRAQSGGDKPKIKTA